MEQAVRRARVLAPPGPRLFTAGIEMSSIEDIHGSCCGTMSSTRVLEFFHKQRQPFSAHSAVLFGPAMRRERQGTLKAAPTPAWSSLKRRRRSDFFVSGYDAVSNRGADPQQVREEYGFSIRILQIASLNCCCRGGSDVISNC